MVKLYYERRQDVLGSKFRTKLVLTFVVLILIPTSGLFIVGTGMINAIVNNWFSPPVERSLRDAVELAHSLLRGGPEAGGGGREPDRGRNHAGGAPRLGRRREALGPPVPEAPRREHGPDRGPDEPHALPPQGSRLRHSRRGRSSPGARVRRERLPGRRSRTSSRLPPAKSSGPSFPSRRRAGGIPGIVIIDVYFPPALVSKLGSISTAYDEYRQLQAYRTPIKASYFLTFLLITLAILFIAIWYGLYLSKGITIPIQKLAEATHRVSQGTSTSRWRRPRPTRSARSSTPSTR